jgi:hypothetical protein
VIGAVGAPEPNLQRYLDVFFADHRHQARSTLRTQRIFGRTTDRDESRA